MYHVVQSVCVCVSMTFFDISINTSKQEDIPLSYASNVDMLDPKLTEMIPSSNAWPGLAKLKLGIDDTVDKTSAAPDSWQNLKENSRNVE